MGSIKCQNVQLSDENYNYKTEIEIKKRELLEQKVTLSLKIQCVKQKVCTYVCTYVNICTYYVVVHTYIRANYFGLFLYETLIHLRSK